MTAMTPTERDGMTDHRDTECVANWPDCWDGGYDPKCCRFPKSCSCGGEPPTPATEESSTVRFRPGQLWLDSHGQFWDIMLATDQGSIETRQRCQTFSVWRPLAPPPGWSRLS